MRLHRFIFPFKKEDQIVSISDKNLIHQISTVLRISRGHSIILNNGEGDEIETKIEDVGENEIIVKRIKNLIKEKMERDVTLCCAILKKDNFELVVQKAVEIGITKIIPLITERTVKTGYKRDRLETIIKEAVEQSGQLFIPKIEEPSSLKNALLETQEKQRILFDIQGEKLSDIKFEKSSAIFIGPEGGWSDNELELAREGGASIVSLGVSTLRGETAAIVGSFLAVSI